MWERESKRKLTVPGKGEISDSVRAKVLNYGDFDQLCGGLSWLWSWLKSGTGDFLQKGLSVV